MKDQNTIQDTMSQYKNIILKLYPVLIWKQSHHLAILSTFVSAIFFTLWLIDISVISKCCFLAIIATIIDYLLPIVETSIKSIKWDANDRQTFEQICEQVELFATNCSTFYRLFRNMKYSNTKTYYGCLLTSLLIVAWIGSAIHNLLLVYFLTLFTVLYPGLVHNRIFSSLSSKATSYFKKRN